MSPTSILLITHAPLAHALRECVLHVFPDCGDSVAALDIPPNQPPEESLAQARILLDQLGADSTLVLTDVFGATPCNVAQRAVEGVRARLVTGVNLPMLLRAVTYRGEGLDSVVNRAVVGGTQGVMQVAISAPQNQNRRNRHDQDPYDHQQ
jgi:PTS system mannose-specific IIA component